MAGVPDIVLLLRALAPACCLGGSRLEIPPARKALTWSFLDDAQRLRWAAMLELDAVPTEACSGNSARSGIQLKESQRWARFPETHPNPSIVAKAVPFSAYLAGRAVELPCSLSCESGMTSRSSAGAAAVVLRAAERQPAEARPGLSASLRL